MALKNNWRKRKSVFDFRSWAFDVVQTRIFFRLTRFASGGKPLAKPDRNMVSSKCTGAGIARSEHWPGYGVVDPRSDCRYLSSPKCPYPLWCWPTIIFNRHRRFFLWGQSGRDVDLTTHVHLVRNLRMSGDIPLPPPLRVPPWRAQGLNTFSPSQ